MYIANLVKISLLLALVFWSSTGCYSFEPEREPPIALSEVDQAKNMLYATETSVNTFFERVLNVRPHKAVEVGSWQVLHQDEAFIYYGYPVLRGILTSESELDILYKVSLYQVQQRFPDFWVWQAENPSASFTQRVADVFGQPVDSFYRVDYQFDPERSDFFAFESNIRFQNFSEPCRYRFELVLPTLVLRRVEALPIQQKISAICPEVSSLSL